MKFRTALMVAALLASTGIGAAQAASLDDSGFIAKAQSDVLGQYALAALARGKASDASAKALANEVASNADKANAWLKHYAQSHNVSLTNKPTVRTDAQYGSLQGLKGSGFDSQFAQYINIDAQMELGDFQDAAASASDPAVKTFAKQQAAQLQKFSAAASKLGH